ncbi:unnamed protein product [Polarella glacialis]|uniref:Uncharacterized protein n=1 Tax=Polarella glacialis TaxID=89957 RepID=A0A813FP09_POLGL|nr:unnamed protein product [Polarella glacialis]
MCEPRSGHCVKLLQISIPTEDATMQSSASAVARAQTTLRQNGRPVPAARAEATHPTKEHNELNNGLHQQHAVARKNGKCISKVFIFMALPSTSMSEARVSSSMPLSCC